jgi:hypothetical protein
MERDDGEGQRVTGPGRKACGIMGAGDKGGGEVLDGVGVEGGQTVREHWGSGGLRMGVLNGRLEAVKS